MVTHTLKQHKKHINEEGFTLIELMIVVVIISVLSAIAIPIFMNQQKTAIGATLKSDTKNTTTNIALALVKYPTATIIDGQVGTPGLSGVNGKVGNSTTETQTFTMVISDRSTTMLIGSSNTNPTNITHFISPATTTPNWKNYAVATYNPNSTPKAVIYFTANGTTVSGDTPPADIIMAP